jgi:hypothetical protein
MVCPSRGQVQALVPQPTLQPVAVVAAAAGASDEVVAVADSGVGAEVAAVAGSEVGVGAEAEARRARVVGRARMS